MLTKLGVTRRWNSYQCLNRHTFIVVVPFNAANDFLSFGGSTCSNWICVRFFFVFNLKCCLVWNWKITKPSYLSRPLDRYTKVSIFRYTMWPARTDNERNYWMLSLGHQRFVPMNIGSCCYLSLPFIAGYVTTGAALSVPVPVDHSSSAPSHREICWY